MLLRVDLHVSYDLIDRRSARARTNSESDSRYTSCENLLRPASESARSVEERHHKIGPAYGATEGHFQFAVRSSKRSGQSLFVMSQKAHSISLGTRRACVALSKRSRKYSTPVMNSSSIAIAGIGILACR